MLSNKLGKDFRSNCLVLMCRLCNICVRIVIRTIAVFMSAFVSLKTLLENKLNKARWPPIYQICHCNAISATSQTFLLMTQNS